MSTSTSVLYPRDTYTNIRADSVIVGDLTMLESKEGDLLTHVSYVLDCRLALLQDLTCW